MGTIVDAGDGRKQTLQIVTKSNRSNEKEVAAPTATGGSDTQKQKVFTIAGLKYYEVRATSGERVSLIREPENKYDPNAIKVVNSSQQIIGHIKATTAALESKIWDSQNAALKLKGECLVAKGTILGDGNEWDQLVKVEFKRIRMVPETTNRNNAKVASNYTAGTACQNPKVFTIVDLVFADACAASGEKVTLIREDSSAIKVVNKSKQYIGRIQDEEAIHLCKTWDSLDVLPTPKGMRTVAMGTILDAGDKYKQSVRVEFQPVVATEAKHSEAVVAPCTTGISTPKGAKRTAAAVPVTVSAKKARRGSIGEGRGRHNYCPRRSLCAD